MDHQQSDGVAWNVGSVNRPHLGAYHLGPDGWAHLVGAECSTNGGTDYRIANHCPERLANGVSSNSGPNRRAEQS